MEPPTDARIGQVFENRYRVLRRLGSGNFGDVYEAVHLMIDRRVAIKVLRLEIARPDVVGRFLKEARAAGVLKHPNVVEVTDAATLDGAPFCVFELLVGQDLQVALRAGAIDSRKAARIAMQVAFRARRCPQGAARPP